MRNWTAMAVVTAFLVSSAGTAVADGPQFTFGASASYTFDFNDPDPAHTFVDLGPDAVRQQENNIANNVALYGSQEQDESFNIDMIQLGMTGERGIVSYGAKLDLGDLAALAGDSSDGDLALQEAYLGLDCGPLTITAGRFGTPIGYEVLEPWGNAYISRSRAWGIQPVNHDGLSLSFSRGMFSGLAGIVNGFTVTDPDGNNPDDEYGALGAVGISPGPIDLWLAGIYTDESDTNEIFMLNAIVSGDCGNCRWALESTYKNTRDDREGAAPPGVENEDLEIFDVTAYAGVDLDECWSVDLRASMTNFDSIEDTGRSADNDIWSLTAAVGYKITDGVQLRAEYRHDDGRLWWDGLDGRGFADDDSDSTPKDNIDVAQVQLTWTPGS